MNIVRAISGEPVKVFLLFQQEWWPCIDGLTGVENIPSLEMLLKSLEWGFSDGI